MVNIQNNSKILIVRLTALGDCIHTIPLACALKKAYPNIYIGWAVSEKCKDLIVNNPIIDKVHILPKNNKKLYFEKLKEIRSEKYDISIDTQELLKSAIVSFCSGAKHRLAHANSREFSFFFANEKLKPSKLFDTSRHVIERNLDFAKYFGIEKPEIEFNLPQTTNEDIMYIDELLMPIDYQKPVVTISPATTWITKFWTIENWSALLEELNNLCNFVFTGSKADIPYINKIIEAAKTSNTINLAGKTNILQLKELFSRSDIVITPDSGSAHLAAALNKPKVVTLFGSTSSIRNAAFGSNNINYSLKLNCQPCYKKTCKYKQGIPKCMELIYPDVIAQEIKKLLP